MIFLIHKKKDISEEQVENLKKQHLELSLQLQKDLQQKNNKNMNDSYQNNSQGMYNGRDNSRNNINENLNQSKKINEQSYRTYYPNQVNLEPLYYSGTNLHQNQRNQIQMPPPYRGYNLNQMYNPYKEEPLKNQSENNKKDFELSYSLYPLPESTNEDGLLLLLYQDNTLPDTDGCGDLFPEIVQKPKDEESTDNNTLFNKFMNMISIPPVINTNVSKIKNVVQVIGSTVSSGVDNILDELSYTIAPAQRRLLNGAPPASQSAIEECPTIKITENHVKEDNSCTICMQPWTIGEEVKELPCLHVFHYDCIVPWLTMHGLCPVCRFDLKTDSGTYERYKKKKNQREGKQNYKPPRVLQKEEIDQINIDTSSNEEINPNDSYSNLYKYDDVKNDDIDIDEDIDEKIDEEYNKYEQKKMSLERIQSTMQTSEQLFTDPKVETKTNQNPLLPNSVTDDMLVKRLEELRKNSQF